MEPDRRRGNRSLTPTTETVHNGWTTIPARPRKTTGGAGRFDGFRFRFGRPDLTSSGQRSTPPQPDPGCQNPRKTPSAPTELVKSGQSMFARLMLFSTLHNAEGTTRNGL